MEKKALTQLQKGLILALIQIALSVIFYALDLMQETWASILPFLVFFSGIIWASITFGKSKNSFLTFGDVFAHGFKVAAVVTSLVILFNVLFLYLFPEMKMEAINKAREQMENDPRGMTEEQIEMGIQMTEKYFNAYVIGITLFFYLIVGLIASVVGAIVTPKKGKFNPFLQSTESNTINPSSKDIL